MRGKNRLFSALTLSVGIAALCHLSAHAAPEFNPIPKIAQDLKLPVVEWSDPEQSEKGVIFAIHGLTLYSETFDELARKLASQGYTTYAYDLRGFGKWLDSESDESHTINFTQSREDLLNIISYLRQNNSNKQIFCLGESMGANLSLWIASERAQLVDGLILSAICYKTDWHPRWRWISDVMHGLAFPKRQMLLTPYIVSNLSHDENVTKSYLSDKKIRLAIKPAKLIKAALTNRIALKNVERIPASMPILIINGERDMLFKSKSVSKLCERIPSKDLEVHILSNKGHLLLEHQQPLPLVQRLIDSWLAVHSAKAIASDDSNAVKVAKEPTKSE